MGDSRGSSSLLVNDCSKMDAAATETSFAVDLWADDAAVSPTIPTFDENLGADAAAVSPPFLMMD